MLSLSAYFHRIIRVLQAVGLRYYKSSKAVWFSQLVYVLFLVKIATVKALANAVTFSEGSALPS